MKYCQNCGHEIENNANYCPHCSTAQHAVQQQTAPGRKKLHCPECKSTRLSTIVETTMNGGTAVHTPVTRRVGVSTITTSSTHRNYWMCNDCGHKFRNLQNLKEELAAETKRMKMARVFTIFFGIFMIILLSGLSSDPSMVILLGPVTVIWAIITIVFLVMWLSTAKKVTNMRSECDYLEVRCFD